MIGIKINDSSSAYNIGDSVSFLLQVDDNLPELIGETIQVDILDIFGNSIDTQSANRIPESSIYELEYSIPYTLSTVYNSSNQEELDSSFFYLIDRWNIPSGLPLSFNFSVGREMLLPTPDNNKITITIDGLFDVNNNLLDPKEIEFTTKLSPFYGNVESIRSYYRSELNNVSSLDIAADIIEWSKYVDLHLKPDYIAYRDVYDNAVREYINASIAKLLLLSILNTTSESKQLDTLQIKRESGGQQYTIKKLEELIESYENMVYAGGLDTPFRNKLFTKGILDPNRPNVARASLNTDDRYPWVNVTTDSTLMTIDGQTVEIRGTRTVQFRTPVYNTALPTDSLAHQIEVAF